MTLLWTVVLLVNGTEVYGEVHNSVLGAGVAIGKGSVVRDSIIMRECYDWRELCD